MASIGPAPGAHMPSLREKAYGSFTAHLLARDLRPGQFISQRELVRLTGLTLGAIRELIPRLEAEGLIQTVPKRGMQIAHVDLNLIRDAFELREFLEVEAARSFARQASADEIARLRRAHEDILARTAEAKAAGGIPDALIAEAQDVDWNLHATIIDRLGNRIIANAYRVNAIKIRLIRQEQTTLNTGVVEDTMGEHMAIIGALEARDEAAVAQAMRAHIANARRRALESR